MDNAYSWSDLESHIERREDNGCWTWDGFPLEGNVYRIIAKAYRAPLPAGQKLYRMPECKLGKACINPSHLGTAADFVLALNGRREEIPEPPRAVKVVRLTKLDRLFLKSLRISWE
jgi:hypothetical protein